MSACGRTRRGLLGALHVLTLGCWLAAIIAAGVSAMAVFTMLPKAEIVVPRFEPYIDATTPDRSAQGLAREHGRLAGGMVMDPVFRWTDRVQAGLAVLALLSLVGLGLRCGRSRRDRAVSALRLACVLVGGLLVAWQLAVLGPRMELALHGWWDAAASGDWSTATALRSSFDADHVAANRLYNIRLLLVVAALALAGFATVGVSCPESSSPSHTP